MVLATRSRGRRYVPDTAVIPAAATSLTVWSGFRFAKRAHDRGVPIAIVNIGATRADDLAALKIEDRCGDVLRQASMP